MRRGTAPGVVRIIGATLRLFVAIEVNEAVRSLAREACKALVQAGVTGRYESPEKLHVTVAFLGNVRDDQRGDVLQAFGLCACPSLSLEFDRLGAYPNVHRPHVIWIGSSRSNPQFKRCARAVREAFTSLGFSFDHDPEAHVSICRPKGSRLSSLPVLAGSARLEAHGLTLFQSVPAGPTTRYEAIARTPEGDRT
jgi:2'-5' RNA ligase